MQTIRLAKLKCVLLMIALLLLSGCAAQIMAPTPARDFLSSSEEAPIGFGAYGYLIFTKRPEGNECTRYNAVYNAFQSNLDPVSKYSEHARSSIMPTYWLIEVEETIDYRFPPDCDLMVKRYNYARAKTIASAVQALSSEGPILVAWSQPFEMTSINETALVLELSDFSNEDLDRAFGIWMDRITRDPEIWNAGFNLALAKEAFRNFFEKYGDNIIKAVERIKEIIS